MVTPPSPDVTCEMKSLAYQVVLNVVANSTDGMTSVKKITGLEIVNSDGCTAISNSGTCNIVTGGVIPNGKQTDKLVAKMGDIPLAKLEKTAVKFRSLIPASFEEGEVQLNVTIYDGNNITVVTPINLPTSKWIAGNTYSYDIVVNYTRNTAKVVITDVNVQPWSNGGSNRIDIED
jgi:hypothetical protein